MRGACIAEMLCSKTKKRDARIHGPADSAVKLAVDVTASTGRQLLEHTRPPARQRLAAKCCAVVRGCSATPRFCRKRTPRETRVFTMAFAVPRIHQKKMHCYEDAILNIAATGSAASLARPAAGPRAGAKRGARPRHRRDALLPSGFARETRAGGRHSACPPVSRAPKRIIVMAAWNARMAAVECAPGGRRTANCANAGRRYHARVRCEKRRRGRLPNAGWPADARGAQSRA
jgi:hypothetical protein